VIFDVLLRLEPDPHQRDLARGWAAELADPAWLLGRQWQMGEHQGEDASSPVRVDITSRGTAIEPLPGQPGLDPATVPAEAVLESEPGDWWTPGRRVRAGRLVAASAESHGLTLPADGSVDLAGLPAPYDGFDGTGPDGRLLYARRAELGLDESWFGSPQPEDQEPVDLWDPALFSYDAQLAAGGAQLSVSRHDGGDLDWYSADATGALGPAGTMTTSQSIPGRLRYPSAPLPRWWQIEDAQVSIGGQAPDRANLATLVLVDLIVNHSEDWFTVDVPARFGQVQTLDQVEVLDSFGQSWPLTAPQGWGLFRTQGLDPGALVLWATTVAPLQGPVLDEVVIGIDEDVDLVWAVERVVGGRTMPTPSAPPTPPGGQLDPGARQTFSYRAMTPIPAYWHPYVLDVSTGRRRFVQGRAADLSGPQATLLSPPVSDLLYDPRRRPGDPVHQIDPAAVPSDGVRVERRAMLARATSGEPVLWTQRRRQPLLTPPTFALRFDVLDPDP
jgi:hypothetical protein